MDLRATCLGDSQCPQYFSRFFCCFLEVKSRLHRFFREKRWLERIVLCGFIQKFFKKYAAFFGRDLPQCAPQNQQVLRGALRAAAIRAFVCHRFLCACSEAHSSQRV